MRIGVECLALGSTVKVSSSCVDWLLVIIGTSDFSRNDKDRELFLEKSGGSLLIELLDSMISFSTRPLYLNREPLEKKLPPVTTDGTSADELNVKKIRCSTAHLHTCLHAEDEGHLNPMVCFFFVRASYA